MSDDRAHITEPTVIRTRAAVSTLRLPYMSPARPSTGVKHRTRQQGRRDHPGHRARRGVRQPGQVGQERYDDGLHDGHEDAAERQHRNGEPVAQGSRFRRAGYRARLVHRHSIAARKETGEWLFTIAGE